MAFSAAAMLILDRDSVVQQVQFPGEQLAEHRNELLQWEGRRLSELRGVNWDAAHKLLRWHSGTFYFEQFPLNGEGSCLVLWSEDDRNLLMEAALDQVKDGIQLYGADSSVRFFNRASKRLLDIPQEQNVEGQFLLDFFDVDEEYSTTLTALRTKQPVRNRFDTYKSTTGKDLTTVTSAYPVFRDGVLLGSVTWERDMDILKRELPELTKIQQQIAAHLSAPLSQPMKTQYVLQDLVGRSPELRAAVDLAARMAPRDNSILIQGETGTGKEIFAQGIHALSSRRNERFIAVNCAAFPETLIESMLFGTAKGAFTGSVDRGGLIEAANHGTLFLDELNSMSLAMQSKLLRVFQEHTLQRVGSTDNIPIDVRLISSCNEDVFTLTEQGRMRKDLFYRVAAVILMIPPLRERMEDLEELTWHYIRRHQNAAAQPITEIHPHYWERLRSHNWPGNVRELFHILSYSISVAEGGVLRETDFPAYFARQPGQQTLPPSRSAVPETDFRPGLSELVRSYERQVLSEAYAASGRNATRMAELLKISRQNCQYYIKKYQLNRPF